MAIGFAHKKIQTKYSERKVIENEEKCFISGCFLLSFFVWLVYFVVNYVVPELLHKILLCGRLSLHHHDWPIRAGDDLVCQVI